MTVSLKCVYVRVARMYVTGLQYCDSFSGDIHFLNNSSPKLAQSGAGRPFGSGCLVVETHPSEPEHIFSPMKLPASPSSGFL